MNTLYCRIASWLQPRGEHKRGGRFLGTNSESPNGEGLLLVRDEDPNKDGLEIIGAKVQDKKSAMSAIMEAKKM